jgi:LacI family gluconate utilization system Gnt-I transcriptional repressor
MADVARLAGVSAMTVSRALRPSGSVSQKTRARVMEVIDEIGYVPDQSAGSLSSGRSGLVAAILPTLTNPLFGMVARGLYDTLSLEPLQVFLEFSEYNAAREERILSALLRRRPEAIVVGGVDHTDRTSRMLANAGIPVIECFDSPRSPIGHVVALDHAAVARATVRHVVDGGRRRMAIIAARYDADLQGERRVAAMSAAAEEAGLPAPIILRHGGPLEAIEQGVRGAAETAENHGDVDAILCMSDYAALGAIGELRRRGIFVPNSLAVVGFGDSEFSAHVRPTITTVGFNATNIGVEVAKLVLSAIGAAREERPLPPYRLSLDFQLLQRESA